MDFIFGTLPFLSLLFSLSRKSETAATSRGMPEWIPSPEGHDNGGEGFSVCLSVRGSKTPKLHAYPQAIGERTTHPCIIQSHSRSTEYAVGSPRPRPRRHLLLQQQQQHPTHYTIIDDSGDGVSCNPTPGEI